MLTPVFELTQNKQELIVCVQVPFAKVSDVQVEFEDHDFMFYSKPYYLRLNLPGKVAYPENQEPDIKYDFDKRIFIIHVPKVQKGEIFENLDLITRLLAPRKKKIVKSPLIEVIEGAEDGESEEEFDWSVEQFPANKDLESIQIYGEQCGFANSYSFSVFNLKEETAEIFDVKDPQNKTPLMRKEERLKEEAKDFNEDHYVADLYEDDAVQNVLKYQPEWEILYEELQTNSYCEDEKISFTTEENYRLLKLPNKEYLLDKAQRKSALLGLIDVLFAYAYDKRTTEGEHSVESAWTINKLSATLSWLEVFTSDISEVAHTCIRRSLCYPMYRHFELSVTCLEDVRKILLLGRNYVIKCLLKIHELFNLSEPRYILNDLFITDYCVWMQTKRYSLQNLEPVANALGKVLLTKGDINLNLVDIESFAAVAWMHQENLRTTNNSVENVVSNGNTSNESIITTESLNSELEKLSLKKNTDSKESDCKSETSEDNSIHSDESSDSDYEICSSCTSDSSDSSSTFESSDSSEDSDVEV